MRAPDFARADHALTMGGTASVAEEVDEYLASAIFWVRSCLQRAWEYRERCVTMARAKSLTTAYSYSRTIGTPERELSALCIRNKKQAQNPTEC